LHAGQIVKRSWASRSKNSDQKRKTVAGFLLQFSDAKSVVARRKTKTFETRRKVGTGGILPKKAILTTDEH
jgi:hypothetical protein